MIREKDIEKYLKTEVKKAGGLSFKFSSPAHRGVPDQIVIFYPDLIFFVEVKAPKGIVSKLQAYCINQLRDKGCSVTIVYSKVDVDEFIRHCKNFQKV